MSDKYLELSEILAALDSEYLEHHQIKGAKWGVRHGPPYPLQSGIRTKIKKVTAAAKKRVQENQQKRAARRTDKAERSGKKKETLQDRINKMSDEELIARTNRLRLENAYKQQLPKEKDGESFLKKSADVMNNLRLAGDAFGDLMKTGQRIGKMLGLVEDDSSSDYDWSKRKSGETPKQYSERLNALKNIRTKQKEFAAEDKKAREAAAAETARKKAEEAARKAQEEYERKKKKQDKQNRQSGAIIPWTDSGRL